MPTPPEAPDQTFARQFASTLRYGFYIRMSDTETIAQVQAASGDNVQFIALALNPQQITMREPIATNITYTQGGGKYIESRGGLIKNVQISGTTGYTPLSLGDHVTLQTGKATYRSRNGVNEGYASRIDTLAPRSGYFAFYQLRYLFRRYMYERRLGHIDVTMHYFDFKGNEFWRIEPQEFTLLRSSKKPYSYDYSVSFQCIEPSETGRFKLPSADHPIEHQLGQLVPPDVTKNLSTPATGTTPASYDSQVWSAGFNFGEGRLNKSPAVKQTLNRFKVKSRSGLDYIKHLSGVIKSQFQNLMRRINNVVEFFEDVHFTAALFAGTWEVLLRQLDNTLEGVFNTIDLYTEENIRREINEFCLEISFLLDHLRAHFSTVETQSGSNVNRANNAFTTGRLRQGATTDLLKEPAGSTGSLDTNPFLGRSGLDLVTSMQQLTSVRSVRAIVIHCDENIYSLALRVFGNMQRFIDLVLLNNLDYPYIVTDKANKPSNTLACGEYINVPDNPSGTSVGEPDALLSPTLTRTVTRTSVPVEIVDEELTTPWRIDQWIGYTVTLVIGTTEYTRICVGNTADTISVNYPWLPTPSVGDTYKLTLETFDLHRPVTPEARAFGVDILLAFRPQTGSNQNPLADIVIDSLGDTAGVRGLENLIQALVLRLNTEQGRHPFHASFGVPLPIGRPWTEDIGLLYTYFVRRSLLDDPRVEQIRNVQLSLVSGTLSFNADVQPIQVRNSRQITVAVGSQ